MNYHGANKRGATIVLAFLLCLFMTSGLTYAQTAEEYFQQGKADLEDFLLVEAHNNFKSALDMNPTHEGANFYYALTRILMISKSPAFNNLLDRFGVFPKAGRDIFYWTADFKRDAKGNVLLPSTSPTGAEIQAFLKDKMLPAINGALDNLSNVTQNYQVFYKWILEAGTGVVSGSNTFTDNAAFWVPNEWVGYQLLIKGTKYSITGSDVHTITVTPNFGFSGTYDYRIFQDVDIDYGDVLVSRGFLYLVKAGILALGSYNVNIDIDKIVSLVNAGTLNLQAHLINAYKNFLTLLPTEQLFEAKEALGNAFATFTNAINVISGESDPQEDDLIVIDDLVKKQEYLDLLADLTGALEGTTLIRKTGLEMNLKVVFDTPLNLRQYLPTFLGPFKDGSTFIKRDSFPDPTVGGILPNMTEDELQNRLANHLRESPYIPSTFPLVLYDNFTKPPIDTNKWRGGELVREIIKTGDYVYDDFSGAHIDNKKWLEGDFIREIQGGKAVFKQASPNPIVVGSFPYGETNWLSFPDPNSVNSIQADVTVLESSITGSARARARLAGTWYSAASPGGPGLTGDVWANVEIRETSDGLFAQWSLGTCANSICTTTDYSRGGNFLTPITYGKAYTLYIEYDSTDHRFKFRVNNEEIIFDAVDLPTRVGDAFSPQKGIGTRVEINDAISSGYVSATFDNVYANGLLYDKFSLSTIDPNKWATSEYVKEIRSGKFRSKVRTTEASALSTNPNNTLQFVEPSTINTIQTKCTLLNYRNPQGLFELAGISGCFYNDGTTGGGRIGDVVAEVYIGGTDKGNPIAGWRVYKYLDANGNSFEPLDSGTFKTRVTPSNAYTLLLGWNGSKFTFKVGKEELSYTPVTSIEPANVAFRRLRTMIYVETDEKEGTIEALFDEVKIIVGEDYKLLSKTASPNPSTVSIPYNANNQLYFPDPNSVDSIGADVTVLENTISGKAHTRARLAGFWYNDGTPGGGTSGDVQGEIALRKEPTGFRANWFIWKSTNPEGTTGDLIAGGYFSTGITIGVTYPLYISYDGNAHEFRFKIGDEEAIVNKTNTPSLPNRSGPANTPWKEICTRVQINDPAASGYISATFDNVYRNGDPYDDFSPPSPGSPPTISHSKWDAYESVREISEGKFRSKVRSSSATTSSIYSRLEFLYPSEIHAIQAKVTPLAYQNDQGAMVRARIAGAFYNDGTRGVDANDHTGDVAAYVRIGGIESNPTAGWTVFRFRDFGGRCAEEIASGTFSTPIIVSPTKTYTLFLGWDGIQFTFKIGNEVDYYVPESGVYLPTYPWRAIETSISYNCGDPTGKEASMEALFDDVMISGPLLSVSPKSNDFGGVIIRTVSAEKGFTLSNSGKTSIGIESIDLVGGDASMFNVASGTCSTLSPTLGPKKNCTVKGSFSPPDTTTEGEKSAALRIVLDTPGSPAIFVPLKGTAILETISTPSAPTGGPPGGTGTTGTSYTYRTTGESSSNLGHPIQYLFDWGDGTNSGWLPVGKQSSTKAWASGGTYSVKVMARCITHIPVGSPWSSETPVTITVPIDRVSPVDGTSYNVNSLYPCGVSIPTFRWSATESFVKGYEVQFSSDTSFKFKVAIPTTQFVLAVTPPKLTWQKILAIPGKLGGNAHWRVVGKRSDNTIATSEVGYITVGAPQPVISPMFLGPTSKKVPPGIRWENNYNRQFKIYAANDPDFSKPGIKKYVSPYFFDDPCADGGAFYAEKIPASQWAPVCAVGVIGSPIYWYVESTDILGRRAKTGTMNFTLQP